MSRAAKRSPRRPFIDAKQAADLLGKDPRTVRKMVSDRRLEGESVRSANDGRSQWRIFTDQPAIQEAREAEVARQSPELSRTSAAAPPTAVREEALRREIAAREAKLADHEETIRQLTAAAALEAERAESAHKVNEHLLNALVESRNASTKSLQISAIYRDLVATRYIPDDPGSLT